MSSDPLDPGFGYRVEFMSRRLAGGVLPWRHAWVNLVTPSGSKTLSGKSGYILEASRIGERLKKIFDPTDSADEVYYKLKREYDEGRLSRLDFDEILGDTDWSNLQKVVNWSRDNPSKASIRTVINPVDYALFPSRRTRTPSMDNRQFQKRLIDAFNSYNNDLLYDPVPGKKHPGSANSNSFAFSLLNTALGPAYKRVEGDKAYPGWRVDVGMSVPQTKADKVAAKRARRPPSIPSGGGVYESKKITRKDLRNIILEILYER